MAKYTMPDFSVNLSNKTAVVTGAGAGIGRAIAQALASAGAQVVVNDLNPDRADQTADLIRAAGGNATAFDGDISNRYQVSALIERARDTYGQVNLWVNAAGVFKDEAIAKIDEWDWRRQIDVNIVGTFFCVQLVGRVMADEGGGAIVNLASSHATLPQGIGYLTGKAGIVGLTQQAARELAPHRIRVNAVGFAGIPDSDMPAPTPHNALGRLGAPQDVAHAVLFLCSDAASFITGQTLHVDGLLLG